MESFRFSGELWAMEAMELPYQKSSELTLEESEANESTHPAALKGKIVAHVIRPSKFIINNFQTKMLSTSGAIGMDF